MVNVAELTRWMELLVTSVLVYSLTDSALMLGLVLAFENLPRPIFSPFTGIIADRFDRKKIWIIALVIKFAGGVALFVLLWSGQIAPWHVFAAMLLQGISRALEDPARRTAVFDIVGERRVVNALSIDSISGTVGRMVGPFFGGFFVEHVGYFWPHYAGYTWAYAVIVVMHLAAMALVIRVRIPQVEREWRVEPIWNSLGDVVRAALGHRQLLGMLFITTIINGLAFPARQFVPAIGRDYLHVGETLVGVLAAAEALGQLAMAGILASIGTMRYHGRYFAAGAFTVMVLSTVFVWSPWYASYFCHSDSQRNRPLLFWDHAGRHHDALVAAGDARSYGWLAEPVHRHRHPAGRPADRLVGRFNRYPNVRHADRPGVHCDFTARPVPDPPDYAPLTTNTPIDRAGANPGPLMRAWRARYAKIQYVLD